MAGVRRCFKNTVRLAEQFCIEDRCAGGFRTGIDILRRRFVDQHCPAGSRQDPVQRVSEPADLARPGGGAGRKRRDLRQDQQVARGERRPGI